MSERLAARAGSAMVWSAVQLFGSKIISLARFLILARLLAPEDFGLLAIAAVAVELLIALSNFGINEALVQRDALDGRDYDTAWTLRVIRAVLVAAVLVAAAPLLASAFGEPDAAPFIAVLALRPLVDAGGSIKLVTLTRSLSFRPLAMLLLPALVLDAVVSVALAPSLGAWSVVIGAFVAATAGAALSYVVAPYRPRPALDRAATAAVLRFGRWLLVASAVGVVGHLVLRVVIARDLGVAELGIFYLGAKITLLPNDLAGEVVRAVAFPVVARVQSDVDRTKRAFQSSLTAMVLLLVPVYGTMIVLAQPLVLHLLGSEWAPMVPVVQLLAIDGIIDILADAAKPLVLGLGHPQRRALLKGIRTVVILVAAWPLVGAFGLAGAAGAFLAAEFVQFVAAYFVVRRSLFRPFAALGGRVAAIVGAAAVGAGAAWALYQALSNPIGLGLAAALSAAAALAGVTVADRRYRLGIASDLAQAFPTVATRLGVEAEGT